MVTIARKRHAQRHKHPKPFNFVSGFIYTGAVIVSITLGALFYRGYRDAGKAHARANPGEEYVSPDLPPGAKVITRAAKIAAGIQKSAVTPAPAPKPATVPTSSPTASAPEVAAPPVFHPPEPARASPAMPDLKPLSQIPWTSSQVQLNEAQQVKLMPIADTSVLATPAAAQNYNGGLASELPVRGNTAFLLTRYDAAAIKGWTVSKATWHAKVKRGTAKALSFSTILTDWDEGPGQLTEPAPGATFSWASHKKRTWRADGAPVTSVIRGNGYSRCALGIPDPLDNGAEQWISVNVDPVIVQAMVAGASYGIAICDEKGRFGSNLSFVSRENSNDCPFLEVTGASTDIEAPGSIRDLEAFAHPDLRMKNGVGVLLTWKATGDDGDRGQAFKYDVRYAISDAKFESSAEVPRHAIPHPQVSGQSDRMIIEGLDPDTTYDFFIRAVDDAGQEGAVVETTLTTAGLLPLPVAEAPRLFDSTPIDIAAGVATLQILDEAVLVDPVSGKSLNKPDLSEKQATQGYLWDRTSRTMHLRAARNETVGFLIVLGKKGARAPMIKISAQPFRSAKAELAGEGMRFFRTWYTTCLTGRSGSGFVGDALKPLSGYMTFPSTDNPILKQAFQTVYAELHVPSSAEPGLYPGSLVFTTSEGVNSSVNVILTVLPTVLPDRSNFVLELAAPSTLASLHRKDLLNPNDSMPIEIKYDQLARDHRCTLAMIPYARNGSYPAPLVPKVSDKALNLKLDWTDWDRRFGKYLDSSTPATHIVLPLFENWPTPFESGYLCANQEVPGNAGIRVYMGLADEIHGCMSSDYWRSWRTAVQQIGSHFQNKGWVKTAAHVWLNNGPTPDYKGRYPPWSFLNPVYRDDLVALESFAQITKADTAAQWPANSLTFRANVPDGSVLAAYGNELFDLLSVGDPNAFVWADLRTRAATYGTTLWFQNESIPLGPAPVWVNATALSFFLEGADGWSMFETVGRPENWTKGQPQCLVYPGVDEPFPSHRLKALRRAQQDIELLILLQKKMSWTREQLGEFVRRYLPGERGAYTPSADELYALRYAVHELLK